MALYSPELMRRIASHALDSGSQSNWGWRDGFLTHAEHAHADRPVAIHDRDPQSGVSSSGQLTSAFTSYARHLATFDPDTEQDTPDELEYKFERRDDRVLLRMYAWFTVGELDTFYNTSYNQSVLVCNKYYNGAFYHQITLRVAVRREADADLPENWVGAKDPDIRLVYDHTKPSHFRVLSDLLVDVTELLCTSSRYPELVEGWKTRFSSLTELSMRLRNKNRAPDATITSPNTVRSSGGPDAVADGGTYWGSSQWNPNPDEEGKASLIFAYDRSIVLGQIKIYGHSAVIGGVEHYSPYRWYVEGSVDGQAWQAIEVAQCVERCSKGVDGVLVAEKSGSTAPIVVELDTATSKFSHFRLVFLDYYHSDNGEPSWLSIPVSEVEFYEVR